MLSLARKDPREKFADIFAGEFLMPTEGIRRVMEEHRIGPRIDDPADVIHLQRYFRVSYVTALVRLRQARILSQGHYDEFKGVRPVVLARSLGYEIDDEEYGSSRFSGNPCWCLASSSTPMRKHTFPNAR